jgi:hypothetical protein
VAARESKSLRMRALLRAVSAALLLAAELRDASHESGGFTGRACMRLL